MLGVLGPQKLARTASTWLGTWAMQWAVIYMLGSIGALEGMIGKLHSQEMTRKTAMSMGVARTTKDVVDWLGAFPGHADKQQFVMCPESTIWPMAAR